jgi:Predicted dehydrogenases and related proteins
MKNKKIRYAVVGLGHIAQVAVLPAFKNAQKNSELVALISHDETKLKKLSQKYKVPETYSYDELESCLASGSIDALYIATPNVCHRNIAEMAASYGVHVLTEKPMAINEEDCLSMLKAARKNNIKLMVAYRLHFDQANLKAVEFGQSGRLGELRIFNSTFTMQVDDPENIRLSGEMGGGPMFDIGIYCLNASRYLFRDEPIEIFAMAESNDDRRFREVDEMMTVTLRYPNARLASFTISFGAAKTASFDLIGTKGSIRLENAYEYADGQVLHTVIHDKKAKHKFAKHDQFAPELEYFSNCILKNKEPEPSAEEGLLDIKIIEAINESIKTGMPVQLRSFRKMTRPTMKQANRKPAFPKPDTVHVRAPHS